VVRGLVCGSKHDVLEGVFDGDTCAPLGMLLKIRQRRTRVGVVGEVGREGAIAGGCQLRPTRQLVEQIRAVEEALLVAVENLEQELDLAVGGGDGR
jgi:hypothetical protein